jgi:hypothetical protein
LRKDKDKWDNKNSPDKTAIGDSAGAGFPGISNEKPVGSLDGNSPYSRKNDALRNRSYQRVAQWMMQVDKQDENLLKMSK